MLLYKYVAQGFVRVLFPKQGASTWELNSSHAQGMLFLESQFKFSLMVSTFPQESFAVQMEMRRSRSSSLSFWMGANGSARFLLIKKNKATFQPQTKELKTWKRLPKGSIFFVHNQGSRHRKLIPCGFFMVVC